mmetsp:Transcript_45129/g.109194  ORF Transcript_45129/g.109194 Transcript_45129/m.109194 type:complete len:448 (-) Transcript_45129:885-2228(-)
MMKRRRPSRNHSSLRTLALGCILLCRQQTSAFTLGPRVGVRLNIQGGKIPCSSSPTKNDVRTTGCRHFSSDPTALGDWESPNDDVKRRPQWARSWMPTWLFNLRPSVQIVALVLAYLFHITVLCQRSIHFPVQLIPNERGYFQSIGLDSIAGMASLAIYQYIRRLSKNVENNVSDLGSEDAVEKSSAVPSLLSTPTLEESPWKNVFKSKFAGVSSFLACCALILGYFSTGRFSIFWEDAFYYIANFFPMTIAMHRSLCVLFGHLSWIAIGFVILRVIPRPQNLFKNQWYSQKLRGEQWLWWTLGGYFVTTWFFNIADFINQCVLPLPILEEAQNSVVSQLISPEFNEWIASAVGYIAPCITAPWWEEVLYRGFLLPALTVLMKYKWAVFWNGIIFSAHHMSATGAIPLAVLAWLWCIVYAKSGNLLSTILIHAMWNSRIFIGSWFGL